MKVIIRPYMDADFERILEIEQGGFSDPWSRQTMQQTLDNPLCSVFVAQVEELVIGFTIILTVPPQSEMLNIAVDVLFRGRSVGKMLMQAVLDFCKENRIRELMLEVRQSNSRAILLYEKFNFRIVGVRKNYYRKPTENALLMTHNIVVKS